MLSIHLHHIIFFGYHGIHEEERLLGNEFELNLTLSYQPLTLPVKHIHETIDYVSVYELVKKRMMVPTPLLETLVTEMAQQLLNAFPVAEVVTVSIRKIHLPIKGIQGSAGVSFELKRSHS